MGAEAVGSRHGRRQDQVSQGISAGSRPPEPHGLPVSPGMGRPRNGLGHHRRGHGRGRHPGIRIRLRLRGRGGTGLRRHHPARDGRAKGKVCQASSQRGDLCRRMPDRAAGRIGFFRGHDQGRGLRGSFSDQRPETLYRGRRRGGLFPALCPDQFRSQGPSPGIPDGLHRGPGSGGGNEISLRPPGLPGRGHGHGWFSGCESPQRKRSGQGQRGL